MAVGFGGKGGGIDSESCVGDERVVSCTSCSGKVSPVHIVRLCTPCWLLISPLSLFCLVLDGRVRRWWLMRWLSLLFCFILDGSGGGNSVTFGWIGSFGISFMSTSKGNFPESRQIVCIVTLNYFTTKLQ